MPNKPKKMGRRNSNKAQQGKKSGGGIALPAIALVVLVAGVYFWMSSGTSEKEFLKAAGKAGSLASRIETISSRGTKHLRGGQSYSYNSVYPTSGAHAPIPSNPGFYTTPPRATGLVHAIEHGNIVIYYDKPGEKALVTIRSWTSLYAGSWSGVLAVPVKGIGKSVVLTAWTKRLNLPTFERAAAASFIDQFRGRGPERKVR